MEIDINCLESYNSLHISSNTKNHNLSLYIGTHDESINNTQILLEYKCLQNYTSTLSFLVIVVLSQ
jgi:hypothetical protein